jgi:YtcA family
MIRQAGTMTQALAAAARAACRFGPLLLGGCSVAPSHSILGSFFPTWIYCTLLGVAVAVVAQRALAWVGIANSLPAPLLAYLALSVAAAFVFWLIWLG